MRTTHNAQRTTHNAQRTTPVSVLILTYNSSWERVKATIMSVIMQKDIDFEVIISDDCSKDNHFGTIKDFLARHSFTNYSLLPHEKNQGIVRNFLDAAKISSGDYIRAIGQGDMFFDEYTLRDSYRFMKEKHAELTVSKAVFYEAFSNPVRLTAHRRYPQDIDAYRDPDLLRESYLMQGQNVSGATVMFERNALIEYMTEAVQGGVKYLEDHMIKCMVFDRRKIFFFSRNTVYYETGAGISTSSAAKDSESRDAFERAMAEDMRRIDLMLLARCEASPSEFSVRLSDKINKAHQAHERHLARQKAKKRLGIFIVFIMPLLLLRRAALKAAENRRIKHMESIAVKTDTDVPADFANFCMNCG